MITYRLQNTSVYKKYDYTKETKLNKIKLFGLIMVKNQENNIIDCISSIKNICDSIIVVDTGSTDNTIVNIKKNYPDVCVKNIKWEENYGKMRNLCISFIPNDSWILFIDSDEVFTGNYSKKEIKMFLNRIDNCYPDQDKACLVKQKLKNVGNLFSFTERFIKKSQTIYYYGFVHEEPRSYLKLPLLKINTDITIINKGFEEAEVKKFSKKKRYNDLMLKNLKKEPNNPRWIALLNNDIVKNQKTTFEYLKMLKKSIFKNGEPSLSIDNIRFSEYLSNLLVNYCIYLLINDDIDTAKKFIMFSHKIYPENAKFIFLYVNTFIYSVEKESKNMLNKITNFLSKTDYSILDDQSDGEEEILSGAAVRLLIQMEKYGEANDLYSTITEPYVKKMLSEEQKLFNHLLSKN